MIKSNNKKKNQANGRVSCQKHVDGDFDFECKRCFGLVNYNKDKLKENY